MNAEQYIGKPWQNGAQGPEAFDCWGFVRHIYKTEKGITLPILDIDADKPLAIRHAIAKEKLGAIWQSVDGMLEDFDVVLLSQASHPDHVGLWHRGALLHCIRGAGVVFESRQSLRRSGWNILSVYRMAA